MNRIREFRTRLNMTSDRLAELVRAHPHSDKTMKKTQGATIRRIENGTMQLTERWLNVFGSIFSTDIRDLLIPTLDAADDGIVEGHVRNAKALAIKNLKVVFAAGNALQEIGVDRNRPLTVDCSEEAIKSKKTGDVVLVSIRSAGSKNDPGIRTLRQFVEPALVITNRRGANLAYHLDDRSIRIEILGVVIKDWD